MRRRDGVVRAVEPTARKVGQESISDVVMLAPADVGRSSLGARATLVQFSTAFCQPCRATRATLSHVAESLDGVEHVEIDAESNLELVRRLDVRRTPTTLVVDPAGRVVGRATGVPRPDDVRAALPN
ncbi:thioredoxin [Actinobacteria bacterium YIM 96077]|uniref:Thioredoxin n=2 Tax=Phytoactinopolyspora halophila TaxID=1981511 RepID=A0A329QPG9_9ACTN|nr:thioredoxin [Actinobacteria bacterium YIM 96077]RAW14143.1 thioredoxin [Phytoactinopolyspora halophila]